MMSEQLDSLKQQVLSRIQVSTKETQRVELCAQLFTILGSLDDIERADMLNYLSIRMDESWFPLRPKTVDEATRAHLEALLRKLGEAENDESASDEKPLDETLLPGTNRVVIKDGDLFVYRARYKSLVKGIIDAYSSLGYDNIQYYKKVWEALSALSGQFSDAEKGYCLYTFFADKRSPYFEVIQGRRMDNETYQGILGQIEESIQKARFVLSLSNGQRTETAAQLLSVIHELEDDDDQIVLLSQIIMMLNTLSNGPSTSVGRTLRP